MNDQGVDRMRKYSFKLFLSELTTTNKQIIENLKFILYDKFENQFSLEILCASENLDLPKTSITFSSPTLIKQSPPPSNIVLGNLNDKKTLLAMIDLSMK